MLSIIIYNCYQLLYSCNFIHIKPVWPMTDHLEKMRKQLLIFKIMMVGQSGVGKSSIVMRYVRNTFTQVTSTTLGIDFLEKKIVYKNKTVRLELWDTSGQQKFKSTGVSRLQRSNAIFCVYQMTESKSLDDLIQYWIPKSVQQCPKGAVFVVFGNKSDLVQNPLQIKKAADERLQKLSHKYQIQILSFMGNCKHEQNRGIQEAMAAITDRLFEAKRKQEVQQEQQQSLNKKRAELQKPMYRESIKIHQNYDQKQRVSKSKKCLFF